MQKHTHTDTGDLHMLVKKAKSSLVCPGLQHHPKLYSLGSETVSL